MATIPHMYKPRGACRELFFCRDSEVLLEGPAGTGKTRGLLEYVYLLCVTFPGIRVLFVRKTRASLTESVLVTWEQKVLPDTGCITGSASAENRRSYSFPLAKNIVGGREFVGRSHIGLGGMDKPTRIMSTEWDIIAAFEANELTETDWESLLSRNRNWVLPFQQAIADTNPDLENHWLNRRAKKPLTIPADLKGTVPEPREGQTQMTRLLSRHKHNPILWDDKNRRWRAKGATYMAKLNALTGPRRARLLEGRWAGAEGQIWEEFDTERHMVYYRTADHDGHPRDKDGKLKTDWRFASMDWGFRDPGVLQIWGVIGRFERMYLLEEWYKTGEQIDWWAEVVCRADARWGGLQNVVCDPSRPDLIKNLNQRICDFRGRSLAYVAIGGNNDILLGIDMVRYGLDPGASMRLSGTLPDGTPDPTPKLLFCWGAPQANDRTLLDECKAASTVDEIPGYSWRRTPDGSRPKEEPDPLCDDHGCDSMRYACTWAWGKDLTEAPKRPTLDPGSIGAILEHDKVSFVDESENLDW